MTSRRPSRPGASSVPATTPSSSDGFAERIERAVERRAAELGELQQRRAPQWRVPAAAQLALGIISLVACIPITHRAGTQRRARWHLAPCARSGGRASTSPTPGSPAATEQRSRPRHP